MTADTWFLHVNALEPDAVVSWTNASIEDVFTRARALGVLPREAAVAFDYHVDPDYSEGHAGCIGHHDLPGTSYGMAYLSAESLDPRARLTLAATPITPFTNREKALREQLARVTRWLAIALAVADRAFFSVYALRLLLENARRFVVPAIRNTRIQSLGSVACRERQTIPGSPYSFFVVPYAMGKGTGAVTVLLVFLFEPIRTRRETIGSLGPDIDERRTWVQCGAATRTARGRPRDRRRLPRPAHGPPQRRGPAITDPRARDPQRRNPDLLVGRKVVKARS